MIAHIDNQQYSQQQYTNTYNGVTELVLAKDFPEHLALLFPMLAHLSSEAKDRWITWIAPRNIHKETLQRYGVDSNKVRLIHTANYHDPLWIMWEALAAGNSHTVIASPGKLSDKEFTHLETAAAIGKTQGILLRLR